MKRLNDNLNAPLLNIVVALDCEARAFIDSYRLKRHHAVSSFKLYSNQEQTIYLIVSGVGKVNMATATGFIAHYTGAKRWACFLNVGIAGGKFPVGKGYLIHKIDDAVSQRTFYPDWQPLYQLSSMAVKTFDRPQNKYSSDYLMDMEASGFMQAVTHFVTVEQVRIIKVVSDDSSGGQNKLSAEFVTELMKRNLEFIQEITSGLLDLSIQESKNFVITPGYDELIKRYHFSHYQKNQLKELLRCWHLIKKSQDPLLCCHAACSAKEVLCQIKQVLALPKEVVCK